MVAKKRPDGFIKFWLGGPRAEKGKVSYISLGNNTRMRQKGDKCRYAHFLFLLPSFPNFLCNSDIVGPIK